MAQLALRRFGRSHGPLGVAVKAATIATFATSASSQRPRQALRPWRPRAPLEDRPYQHIFSSEGLEHASPEDLKAFANSPVGARIGNMSVFNTEWNRLGPERAAGQVREVIGYLLHGDRPAAVEDRLTDLLGHRPSVGMKGLKESILTKVLCVAYPEEYVRFLVYTSKSGRAGKREVAREVWGLELPDPKVSTGLHLVEHRRRAQVVASGTVERSVVDPGGRGLWPVAVRPPNGWSRTGGKTRGDRRRGPARSGSPCAWSHRRYWKMAQ